MRFSELRIIAVELGLIVIMASLAIAQDQETIGTDPSNPARPVSALVNQLRKREHMAISYEDPRYAKLGDMGGPDFVFRYTVHEIEGPDGAELIVGRMLREYAASGGLTFGVQREAMRLYVVPEEVKDAKGQRVRQGTILDTVIDISPANRNGSQILDAICEAVKQKTGYQIDVGQSPTSYLQRYSTREGIYGQTARAALAQLLDKAAPARAFVWDLYYDPEDGSYGLSFAYVGYAGRVQK